jgi:hypothetical protein
MHKAAADGEQRWFRLQKNLKEAIKNAALARMPSGRRFSHQRRIPSETLARAFDSLLRVQRELGRARTFHELHVIVHHALIRIRGIGDLTIYDVSIRLGAFLGLAPDRVYLHAGTRLGAKQLGFVGRRPWILVSELPVQLRTLSAGEAEDVLCIFKAHLGRAYRSNPPRLTRDC